jgi:hypothetical protein
VPAMRSQIAYMRGVCTAGQQHHRQPVVVLAWTVRTPFPHLLSYSTAKPVPGHELDPALPRKA